MDRLLYRAYAANRALMAPYRAGSQATLKLVGAAPPAFRDSPIGRHLSAASALMATAQLTHERPRFGAEPMLDEAGEPIDEVVVDATPFASLVHFRKRGSARSTQPKVLIAAPLSGHFATMLAPTVRTMVLDHDVYITDWHNARDVGTEHGPFGLDEYVDHLIRFLRALGPDTHLFAVCQPCVPAVMAVAALAEVDDPAQPPTLTLMSGPIDTRVSPTRINRLAHRQSAASYRRYLSVVPHNYAGAGRLVYPGFMQVGGFLSLNLRRHVRSHLDIYRSYARGEAETSRRTREFYGEYYAVLDMAGEFYLDTIERVFQQDLLARGEMTYRGRLIRPELITKTALLTIEAERDDMCAPGQTEAAHALFTGIAPELHRQHLQPGVGHYGVFAGSKWTSDVYPVLTSFIAERPTTTSGSTRRRTVKAAPVRT
jgi:poly(3-hydroxybutyrate) depolymerase